MAPLVTCVVLAHNHERFAEEALDSILGQDYPQDRLKLVVIDNGSSDATLAVLDGYRDRATVLHCDDLPPNEAWNIGLAHVEGDYFTMFSGDDVWTPGRLAHMVDEMEARPGIGLLFGDMEVIDADSRMLHHSWREANGVGVPPERMLGRLLERNLVFGPAILMRVSMLRALWPIPAQAAWDDWWLATAIARVAGIGFTPRAVSRYRRHGGNLSNVDSADKRAAFLREDLRFRRWLLQNLAAGEVTPLEIMAAAGAQADGVLRLAELLNRAPASALGITQTDRRRARACAKRAAAASDPNEELLAWAHAFGHDPTDVKIGRALSQASTAAEAAELRLTSPLDPATVIDTAAAPVTLALADELIAEPALLVRYLEGVDPAAPGTLAVHASTGSPAEVADALVAAMQAIGVDPDELPDTVLLGLPDTIAVRSALAVRADFLLTDGARPAWPFAGLPAFAPTATRIAAPTGR